MFAERLLGDECFSLVESRLEILSEKSSYHRNAIAVQHTNHVLNSVRATLEKMLMVDLLFH